jgi:hypothetical protein
MFGFIVKWLHRANRRTDMDILWPACKEHATDLDQAKIAFYFHITNDPAWTDHYDDAELRSFVEDLQ